MSPFGLEYFDSLRAEEESWLEQAFVALADYPVCAGSQSVVVYGASGSGKSALCRFLAARALSDYHRLAVEWSPALLEPSAAQGTEWMLQQFTLVLAVCASQTLKYMVTPEAGYDQVDISDREVIVAGIRCWLGDRYPRQVERVLQTATPAQSAVLRADLLDQPLDDPFNPGTPLRQVVGQWLRAIQKLGLLGVWVLIDQIEGEVELDFEQTANKLDVFLSSLFLFDDTRLSYKIFLPDRLAEHLAKSSVVERRRVSQYRLSWTEEDLKQIVARRLEMACDRKGVTLADVYDLDRLVSHLSWNGGLNPRGWLEFLRPIVSQYLGLQPERRLENKEWRAIRRRSLYSYQFNPDSGEWVFNRHQVVLSGKNLAFMRYLFAHSDQYCSLADLHRNVYLPWVREQSLLGVLIEDNTMRSDYEGIINTSLWRLRQAVEPDPGDAIFIVSHRNKGCMFQSGKHSI